jgi:DNA-binding response OmpR family regulator
MGVRSLEGDSNRRLEMGEAVEIALDLLPHEDPDSDHPSDAARWIRVYRELTDLKDAVLERMGRDLRSLSSDAREEIARTDATLLTRQRDHYQERLAFWYQRQWQLSKLDVDADARVLRHAGRHAELTRREVQLLQSLAAKPGKYLTAEQILRSAWGDPGLHGDEVRTYVARLRRKLARIQAPARIVNRPRRGYALEYMEEKQA